MQKSQKVAKKYTGLFKNSSENEITPTDSSQICKITRTDQLKKKHVYIPCSFQSLHYIINSEISLLFLYFPLLSVYTIIFPTAT